MTSPAVTTSDLISQRLKWTLEDILIAAAAESSANESSSQSPQQLTFLLKVMVTNVTSLLKTVKAVEDEATKGTRALESTIEHIRQELAVSKVLIKNKNKKNISWTACGPRAIV